MAADKFLIRLGADVTALQTDLQKAQTTINSFGNKIKSLGNLSILGIGTGFIAKELLTSLGGFEAEMSKVRAVTQASQPEFQRLRDNAIELAKSYGVTSQEVATLQLEYARLGFTTDEILNTTKATILLSKATGENLATSAQIAGSTLRSFNLDASEMLRVTDVMAASFNKSALALSDFGEAIKYVAPVASAANLTIEQTSAMLGVLADNGIKGSMAGTALRKIISDLGSGAAPILNQRLAEMAAQGLSGAAAMDEVGRTAYASLLVLSKNTDKITEATEAYKNSAGELQKMADIMQDNLYGDYDKFLGQLDATIQKGGGVIGVLRGITQTATGMVRGLGGDLAMPGKHWFLEALGINPDDPALNQGAQTTWDITKKLKEAAKTLTDERTKSIPVIKNIAFFEEQLTLAKQRQKIASEGNVGVINIEIDAIEKKIKALKELGIVSELKRRAPLPTLPDSGSSLDKATLPGIDALPAKLQAVDISATMAQNSLLGLGEITKIDFFGTAIRNMGDAGAAFETIAAKAQTSADKIAMGFGAMATGILASAVAAAGANENIGKAVLKSLSDFGKKYGRQLILMGGAKIAEGLITNNPNSLKNGALAIAAGAALSFASSRIAAGSSEGGGGSGGSSFNDAATRSSVNGTTQNITVGGEFRLQGSTLIAAISTAQQSNNILKGG